MEILKRTYYFFVNTNLLIAAAAIAQCALTYYILNFTINPFVLCIEGATTLILYNLSLYLSKPKYPESSPYLRTRWVFSHMTLFWILSGIAIALSIWSLFHVNYITIAYLIGVGALSLAYAVPIFSIGDKKVGLRQVPGLKVFFIAIVWSLSSVGLPVIELYAEGNTIDWYTANYLGIVKVLFLLLCTLPFDIRDIEQDSHYNLKTIPILLGEKKAINLSYFLAVLHIILIILSPYNNAIKIAMIITSIIILVLLKFVIFKMKNHYHHVYLLDLALILQWFIVLLFL